MELINVMAASLDGRIGSQSIEGDMARQQTGLSSQADQRHLRRVIETADAIVVGASSIRANQECLDHPGKAGHPLVWFILCQESIPESYQFWQQTNIPRILVSSDGIALPDSKGSASVETLAYGLQDPADFVYQELVARGFKRVLLFGGGIINRWFYAQGLVDRLLLTLSPLFIAQNHAPLLIQPNLEKPIQFSLNGLEHEGDYVFLDYQVLSSK